MTRSERAARQHLKRTGSIEYGGFEIWATYDREGYTGHYRMAPAGQREHYRDYEGSTHSLKAIFARIEAEA